MEGIRKNFHSTIGRVGKDNTAYFCWFVGSILSAISFIYPNQNNIDAFTTNLSRAVVMIFFNGIGLYWRQLFTEITSPHLCFSSRELVFVIVRNVIMTVYGLGFAQSQFYLSAPVCYTIFFSGPLFILLIDSTYFKSKISKQQSVGVMLAGFGVLLTANGQAMWSWLVREPEFSTKFKNYKTQSFMQKSLVTLIMVVMTFAWGCAQVLTREIKNKDPLAINFNFGVTLAMISGLAFIINSQNAISSDLRLFGGCIIFHGLLAAMSQTFFVVALLLSKRSGPITMIGFVGVIASYVVSVHRYHEPLSLFCVAGAICALIGIYKTVMN